MSEETFFKKIYSAFFREEFPEDLILVVLWLAASVVASYLPILNQTPVPVVFALPVVLFIPGYCLIAALFPKNDDIGLSERIALSIGFSIAIIPLIGLGLNFSPWGIRLESVIVSITVLTWVLVLVAHYRRAIIPLEERFRMPFSEIASTIREGLFPPDSDRVDRLLSVIFILVTIVAIVTAVYVISSLKKASIFQSFTFLGKTRWPPIILS